MMLFGFGVNVVFERGDVLGEDYWLWKCWFLSLWLVDVDYISNWNCCSEIMKL